MALPAASPRTSPAQAKPSLHSLPRLLLSTSAMAGISLSYAAQINLGTPHLMRLTLPQALVSLAWLAGPLSGLIVQPIVGLLSDSCASPLGRRRPFILIGAVLTSFALLLFPLSHPLAHAILPPLHADRAALALAVLAFFILDFAIQAVQAPLRALVTDVLPPAHLARGNSCVGFYVGLGNLLGGVLVASHLSHYFPFFANDVIAVFAFSAVLLLLSVSVTCISTPETPLPPGRRPSVALLLPTDGGKGRSRRERMRDLLTDIPRPFWQVFAVQLCTWCGFFTLFVYLNSWVGTGVFMGDPTGDASARLRYDKGVRFGGRANALTAVVTLAYSALLPRLLDRFGVVPLYAFSQGIEALCLLSAPLIRGTAGQTEPSALLKAVTMLDVGMFGIVWATTMGVPWTLIGNALDAEPKYAQRLGFYTTLFNASQSFPQLVVAFVAPVVLRFIADPAAVMFLGGLCAVVGFCLVIVLNIDPNARKRHTENADSPKTTPSRRKSTRASQADSV